MSAGQTAAARITPKSLTTELTVKDKIYDGKDTADATVTLLGLVAGENLKISNVDIRYTSKDPLPTNQVVLRSLQLDDDTGLVSNYAFGIGSPAAARINQSVELWPHLPPSAPARTSAVNLTLVPNRETAQTRGADILSLTLPKGQQADGSPIVIPLPVYASEAAKSADASVRVTLPGNKPLPTWLRYLPDEHAFVTDVVPEGALPLLVEVSAGTYRSLIQIEYPH